MSVPYKAIAHISYYVYELLPTGEIGKMLDKESLSELDIKNKVKVIGVGNLDDVANKIKEFERD